jgi:hypothetical protein
MNKKGIRLDLPESVHEQLGKLPGGKKGNAERLLIEWAKRKEKLGVKDESN